MKKLFFFSLFLLIPLSLFSQKRSNAVFKFEKELIDYGKVVKGSNGERVFVFTNIGKSPLIIKDIKTSCDCAIPKKPSQPIMPNEKGKITVMYDTSKLGGFSKVITIFSNANEPRKRIRIKGFVASK